ncbi:MAG TPA: tetratricopeptide repeat protein [Tahibacter sp.]|uniref:YfgM family protein n=1 Tax=Tahibacter sp. TaxID=2056211 RepID=UPI002D1DCF1A|nr:tetratricopeptide repeat protein [Tahibacter sp.]HSX61709.1 tetratricopeptide repeat protein [Tahibacter sp.]
MAFDQLDEHEQSELVRKWIRDNVASIFVGIGLGLLVIFGYFQWQAHQVRQNAMAASEFVSFGAAVGAKNEQGAKTALDRIQKEHAGSTYAVIAAMRWAEGALVRKDLAGAEQSLQWAYDNAKNDAVKSLAGQNLARLKLGTDKAAEALTLLNAVPVAGYASSIAELRGDILLAQGNRDEARSAYQAALDALDATAPNRQSLEMKRDDLGTATAVTAPPAATPAAAPAAEKQNS